MKKFLTIPLAALAMAACSDLSTAPLAEEATAASTSASFSSSGGAQDLDFSIDLNLVESNVLPDFQPDGAKQLRTHIGELRTHLAAGNRAEALRVLDAAQSVLTPSIGVAGDVGYVELVFRDIRTAVGQ